MSLFILIEAERLETEPIQFVGVHPLRWHRVIAGDVLEPQAGFREATAEELAQLAGSSEAAATEIHRLAEFLLEEFPDQPGREGSESAVDVAIRLLRDAKDSAIEGVRWAPPEPGGEAATADLSEIETGDTSTVVAPAPAPDVTLDELKAGCTMSVERLEGELGLFLEDGPTAEEMRSWGLANRALVEAWTGGMHLVRAGELEKAPPKPAVLARYQ